MAPPAYIFTPWPFTEKSAEPEINKPLTELPEREREKKKKEKQKKQRYTTHTLKRNINTNIEEIFKHYSSL